MTDWTEKTAPSLDDFQTIAEAAWASLPAEFTKLCGRVLLQVQDFAEEEVLRDLRIENPFELTGLYQGVDLTQKSHLDPGGEPDMVFLYRRPLLDEWCEHGEITLGELIAHVIVHEIGHHFGLSDDDMHAIEDAAEN